MNTSAVGMKAAGGLGKVSDEKNKEAPPPETLKEVYNSVAPMYGELVKKTRYGGVDWIERKIDFLPEVKAGDCFEILDLACADGVIAKMLSRYRVGYTFTGIDYSEGMVSEAKKSHVYEAVYAHDLNEGVPEVISEKRFDCVLAMGFVEFVSDQALLFDDMAKAVKENGLLFLTVECESEDATLYALDTAKVLYSEEEIKDVLGSRGFEFVDWEKGLGYCESRSGKEVSYYYIVLRKQAL